jgi:23S rRNA (pseudouridine1915-N3)-methyltransferase
MKLAFWSVGKPHESYVKTGTTDFTERIGHYYKCDWKIIAPPKQAGSMTGPALKAAEADLVLSQLGKDDCLVLLDETGKMLSSPGLASFIHQQANQSCRQIVFLIGGAFGVDAAIRQRAQLIWSLSALVFPHMMVRLILAEQVYRACTIIRNEKYHHA